MESLIDKRIRQQSARWPCTQLGVGVVSETVVNAAIELANKHDVDLMLIPSRRQVDTDTLGGGYVCGWDAERFVAHIRKHDHKKRILACRDHGGPWQNSQEILNKLSPAEAMASCKRSYEEDIAAGFSILHLDTSVTPEGAPVAKDAIERLFELLDFCWDKAQSLKRDIAFEIGTEEQDNVSHSLEQFFEELNLVFAYCRKKKIPCPTFVVAQTGTKVMEARNVGLLGSPYRIEGALPTEIYLPRLIKRLNELGIMLKQHNTDYLTDEVLRWSPWLGIHAANVAPEYGVVETRAYVQLFEANALKLELEQFLALAYNSRKWEKWMLPDTTASDRDRAIIAGHYVFSTPEFSEIKSRAARALNAVDIDLDAYVLDKVKESITRYMSAFRLVDMP